MDLKLAERVVLRSKASAHRPGRGIEKSKSVADTERGMAGVCRFRALSWEVPKMARTPKPNQGYEDKDGDLL